MNEEHLSEEEIKEYVSYQVSFDRQEQRKKIQLNKRVLDHIETCEECRGKVVKAYREQNTDDYEAIRNLRKKIEKRITSKAIVEAEKEGGVRPTDISLTREGIEKKKEEVLEILRGLGEKND